MYTVIPFLQAYSSTCSCCFPFQDQRSRRKKKEGWGKKGKNERWRKKKEEGWSWKKKARKATKTRRKKVGLDSYTVLYKNVL